MKYSPWFIARTAGVALLGALCSTACSGDSTEPVVHDRPDAPAGSSGKGTAGQTGVPEDTAAQPAQPSDGAGASGMNSGPSSEEEFGCPIGPLSQKVEFSGPGAPSEKLEVAFDADYFGVEFPVPGVNSAYTGPTPEFFSGTATMTCDADTPEDESDDFKFVDASTNMSPAGTYPLHLRDQPRPCGGRRFKDGERITLHFQVDWGAPDGAWSCSREMNVVLTAVGGLNAGDVESDAISYTALTDCDGGKLDSETGLCWEQPSAFEKPNTEVIEWDAANVYCQDLTTGGHDDWRLPTIDELRSTLRVPYTYSTCAVNLPGGACGISDLCSSGECAADCQTCPEGQGPNAGCYSPTEFTSPCVDMENYLWMSSSKATGGHLGIIYQWGGIRSNGRGYARCVRSAQ